MRFDNSGNVREHLPSNAAHSIVVILLGLYPPHYAFAGIPSAVPLIHPFHLNSNQHTRAQLLLPGQTNTRLPMTHAPAPTQPPHPRTRKQTTKVANKVTI
ncbi:unnamed protein product [Periconia digitata]|uniref:Uncharacterized protein n=1 Tax=Periconia digitata TaxID=1303443 RepID=A0A9W4U155_9PLEO|nr:unnamed protein product [Periconia digitata]